MATTAPTLVQLGPLAQLRAGRLPRRLVQLLVGLVLYGVSVSMLLRGGLGVAPWDVLTSGFIRHVPISFGQAIIVLSFLVVLLWIPLRETPGVGTVANAFLIGLSADATLAVLETPDSLVMRTALMVGGVLLTGLATAVYIGAQLGRGPRDGLMTGLARRTGWSLRLVRTGLEVTVVLVGVALGGQLGLGTVIFALTIGPVTQALLPYFLVPVVLTDSTDPADPTGSPDM